MKAPAKGILRVGGGNVYINNPDPARAARLAAETRSHSWGWSEGAELARHLRGLERYDDLAFFGSDDQRDSNDCVMMVRKGRDVVHFSMTRACKDVPGSKVGHQRVFSMIAYGADMLGETAVACHVAIHPNWVSGIDSPTNPVVREYVKSMKALRAMLDFAKAMGWYTVVTGDFNSRKGDDKRFETVYDLFQEFGMTVRTEGIDGAAWDKRLVLDGWHTIPKSVTKSDHDFWTVADLRRRK